ncbi:MAG: hypothetical protein M1470_06610 [Bacteroidetes bacterium]|nr:hypothetical protein [Bacteroidota bacterium]MCL5739180.1 hypothetical protein [Bacteroidota bacterium]
MWHEFFLHAGHIGYWQINRLSTVCKVRTWATVALLLCFSLTGCDNSTRAFFTHPGRQIVRELETRRLVMLGDFKHGDALSYHSVTSVLNDWVDMLSEGKAVPRHLTLVLEGGDSDISVLRNYMLTGNESPLIRFWIIDGQLERLEFFDNLRRISLRIDSLDETLAGNYRISFRLLGGEAISEYSPSSQAMMKWPWPQAFRYFVTKRDSLAALKIERYFESNPSQKGLIFYGTAHLNDCYVNKAKSLGVPDTANSDGYYLAHYLKRYFGNDSVLSVFQVAVPPDGSRFRDVPTEPRDTEDLLVYHYRDKHSPAVNQYYDAVVFHYENLTMSHPLYYVFSKRAIKDCISTLKMVHPFLPGYAATAYYNRAMWGLRDATGKTFVTPRQWESWYKTHPYDGLTRLSSPAFENPMFRAYREDNAHFKVWTTVYSLLSGLPSSYFTVPDRLDSTQFADASVGILKKVECGNAIGIYWIGYPDEQKEAHQWLVKYTGKNFPTPDQYLKWWRHVVFNADY